MVVHEKAERVGELVGLARQRPDGEHLTGQVGTGQLQRLGKIRLVHVDCRPAPGTAVVSALVEVVLKALKGALADAQKKMAEGT